MLDAIFLASRFDPVTHRQLKNCFVKPVKINKLRR